MRIDFDPIGGRETFHGSDYEYSLLTGLHTRNAEHTRDLVAKAERLGVELEMVDDTEQFGGQGPTQFDVVALPPIPRARATAPTIGYGALHLAS